MSEILTDESLSVKHDAYCMECSFRGGGCVNIYSVTQKVREHVAETGHKVCVEITNTNITTYYMEPQGESEE